MERDREEGVIRGTREDGKEGCISSHVRTLMTMTMLPKKLLRR